MNRGADHSQLFFTRGDGEYFENLLGEGVERTDAAVHAYCLMPNHFHLLVQAPNDLSKFMQRVTTLYARHLNSRHGADGPVFRARFRSLPIVSGEHLSVVARYIHRNPVDLAAIAIDSYRWSSYRCYVGRVQAPPWLSTDAVHVMESTATPTVAISPSAIDWAIATVFDEHGSAPASMRIVACLMLDVAGRNQASALIASLKIDSTGARDAARRQARARAASNPELLDIARRALALLA